MAGVRYFSGSARGEKRPTTISSGRIKLEQFTNVLLCRRYSARSAMTTAFATATRREMAARALPAACKNARVPETRDHGPLPPLLVLLTVMTGFVDSVSYLELGNVFVANMTGNIIFLGLGLGGSKGVEILATTVSTGCFCVGAAVGGHLAFNRIAHRGRLLGAATATQAWALVAAALIVTSLGHAHELGRYAAITVLAVSMGWQYAIVRRLEVPDFRTIVVTTTLTALVADRTEAKERIARRLSSLAALLLGAAIGALLIRKVAVAAPLWCAAVVLIVVAAIAFITSARDDAEKWG
ncbi:YoaK family protein [Actinomadura sp. GTD37]|uniref:YoaK family protein n=1 Tax=Actinomadura sp. GTD37 TaxID=1778030 RepID=UPI0035C243C3